MGDLSIFDEEALAAEEFEPRDTTITPRTDNMFLEMSVTFSGGANSEVERAPASPAAELEKGQATEESAATERQRARVETLAFDPDVPLRYYKGASYRRYVLSVVLNVPFEVL